MAEDGLRNLSGLAVLLSDDHRTAKTSFRQSPERTVEHVLDLPHNSVPQSPVTVASIRSILKKRDTSFSSNPPGVQIRGPGNIVLIDNASVCGELRVVRDPQLIESFSVFSSGRANASVWKGKWMYEASLETAGVQQLGWASVACPFTDRKGVGDAEDSYAFDGKRVSKWNKEPKAYGQSWVVGDVIGCCIDLEGGDISFYRNGVSMGVAFEGIPKMWPGIGYYPAVSLSEGERCDLNFGSRPFEYPVDGFRPIQAPPVCDAYAEYLIQCLSRLLEVQCLDNWDVTYFEKFRRLNRFAPLNELFHLISHGICNELFHLIETNKSSTEYIASGMVVSFLLKVFGAQEPHDYASLDRIVDLFQEFPGSGLLFEHVILALSCSCRVAQLVLTECPYSGSYPYLAMACHILRRKEIMGLWCKSSHFEFSLEGFLCRKSPNKQDLQTIIPTVWWPGSGEDVGCESSMTLTTAALSGAISKIEKMHRELCRLVMHFVPPSDPPELPGSAFRTFLHSFIFKIRGADRRMTSSGVSGNSALVSLYTVILHFLSEGFAMEDTSGLTKASRTTRTDGGFLHRGGKRRFPVAFLYKSDSHRTGPSRIGGSVNHLLKTYPVNDKEIAIEWDEGCMDDEDTKVTHSTRQKPCCCSLSVADSARTPKDIVRYTASSSKASCSSIPERSANVAAECSTGSLSDEIVDKPSSSISRSETDLEYRSLQHLETVPMTGQLTSGTLREEELLDAMLLLYHLGVSPSFRQAFYYMTQQSHSIVLLDDTDKQIREKGCIEQIKRLKEARNVYREELVDCVRQCAWYRTSLFSRWKQRGMYATCMWVVELLLVISNDDNLFLYVPEFYLESLVDCFHALRRSDPPFVSSSVFIKQGLAPFVTFVVKHFNDPRISSTDLKDLLLQSISVLVQYKEYLSAFEGNKEAIERMPRALLSAFDNRSWIPVTHILLRLCKGVGFASPNHSDSSSALFQMLLRETCIHDEGLFSSFLNRLFNTLSWAITEFSITVREMQENYQIGDLQQRKCTVVFDLSCSLAKVMEFITREIPRAFLSGPDMNLRRLTELIIFILNCIISAVDVEIFDVSLRRPGQYPEKTNRAMILAPLVGIILNLMDASAKTKHEEKNDVIEVFASMDCPATVHCGFQYLLNYNWGNVLHEDASLTKLAQLEEFSNFVRSRADAVDARRVAGGEDEDGDNWCCICYACESDALFEPCHHRSCHGCITRHLLNSQRCFFCNATVASVVMINQEGRQLASCI